jgi:hypothetical protein
MSDCHTENITEPLHCENSLSSFRNLHNLNITDAS